MKNPRPIKQKPYIPTQEDIEQYNRLHEIYRYYGIPVGVFSDGCIYTEDELDAMDLILQNKKLPDDLAQRLLATKDQRALRFKKSVDLKFMEAEVKEEMIALGIDPTIKRP